MKMVDAYIRITDRDPSLCDKVNVGGDPNHPITVTHTNWVCCARAGRQHTHTYTLHAPPHKTPLAVAKNVFVVFFVSTCTT